MSKPLSIKIDDKLLQEVERHVRKSRMTRNAYINQAIRLMNRFQVRRELRGQLTRESAAVSQNSLKVLRDFEPFQDEGL